MASSSLPSSSRTSAETAIRCARYGICVPLRFWPACSSRANENAASKRGPSVDPLVNDVVIAILSAPRTVVLRPDEREAHEGAQDHQRDHDPEALPVVASRQRRVGSIDT